MAAVTIDQMLQAERRAFDEGWTEEDLLELAGQSLGHAIGRHYPTPGTAIGYLGKGHNAGDTLVALRILRDHYDWNVSYRGVIPLNQSAPLVEKKATELGAHHEQSTPVETALLRYPLLLIDGLLGTGAQGEIRSPLDHLASEMMHLKQHAGACIAAVDSPSGIDADTGKAHPSTIQADITFMIGNAKLGLIQSAAANHTGSLAIVPVAPLTYQDSTPVDLICPQIQDYAKAPRPYNFHKGMAGKVSILAGSPTFTGAAALTALGALRGGAGLITLHVPMDLRYVVATRCSPEIMVQGYHMIADIDDTSADARVAGCGLGELNSDQSQQLFDWISSSKQPTILDADALNTIAKHERHDLLQAHHLLTPHPGEFQRLAPHLSASNAEERCHEFTQQFPSTLLLKGSRTLIKQNGGSLFTNSTGNPGMATGGQGDLLAGVIASLIAAGRTIREAACLSAWLCGRAAELALQSNRRLSEESMTPSDVVDHIGAAHRDWKQASR